MIKPGILVACLIFLGCNSKDKLVGEDSSVHENALESEYLNILGGLKQDYVLYYRLLKSEGTDLKVFGMIKNDSIFKMDSIVYFESYRQFFQQDDQFIDWLLAFKTDTTRAELWGQYRSPLSSYIGECNLNMNNSRAAVNLLENFLNGGVFQCYECNFRDSTCNANKYLEIEEFLKLHKGMDVDGLRKEWKLLKPET